MGYELWTSTVTGYRRHGTRLADFNAGLGDRIVAGAIFDPLMSCPTGAHASEMARHLTERDFDVAGVKEAFDAPVLGWVRRQDLAQGRVVDHMRPLAEAHVVSVEMTLPLLLNALREHTFVLVEVEGQVRGILTLADLNKPLVRVYFFGLISLLEIHLGFWVAVAYPDDRWHDALAATRLRRTLANQAERQRRGQVLPLVECLEFADKLTLVVNSEELRDKLALGSKKGARRYLAAAEKLRNTLAHSQYDIVKGTTWADLITLIQAVQHTINMSDAKVEARALEMATGDLGALW